MNRDIESWKLAEEYLEGNLSAGDLSALNLRMADDPAFAVDFQECLDMLQALKNGGRQKQFRNMLLSIQQQHATQGKNSFRQVRTIPLRTHYLRTGAVAAAIALLTTLSTFWIVAHNESKRSSQYKLLKRELETIKRSQSALISNINGSQASPVAPANFSGSGFALTNDGYFVTNYHVTEGADSVYIQNKDGEYFKAHLVTFNEKTDVALLKVDYKNFRFSKTDIPYLLAPSKKAIGTRVFTIGYPQDDIVYNEGYISSKNGFEGDSMQYRLEMPANPGQSGAPVIDKSGNVIAIVTGKESESAGTTYAVSTRAIVDLINNSAVNIKLPKSNKLNRLSREQQVEKLENFTCSVKVYKN